MSCYHPNLMALSVKKSMQAGKPQYVFIGKPNDDQFDYVHEWSDSGIIQVPCGKCLGCRLDYSRRWADRMMLELETSKKAVFVTLTYDDDHIWCQNGQFTLRKKDAQLFMKMLRRRYDGKEGRPFAKVRFYLAGEYGEKFKRPHMHAILFGLSLDDFPGRFPHGKNEIGQQYYQVPELEECWHAFDKEGNDLGCRGYVMASDVTWETCAYVARYVVKKAIGDDDPLERGVQPEFVLMSRRPGIGSDYFDAHPEILDFQSISISTTKGVRKVSIPKYYLDKVRLTDPDLFDKISSERRRFANDAALEKLQRTSLRYTDQLEVEEKAKISKMNALKRGDL